jgi:hypothetical protein
MAALLSAAERGILEAASEVQAGATDITAVVRRTVGRLPGPEFRRGVARLAERGLLRAHVTMKVNGDVGRVVIEGITPLGRCVIRG